MPIAEIVAAIVRETGTAPDQLIPLLQKVQQAFGWLPPEALAALVAQTGLSPAAMTEAATFYAAFRLRPGGRHQVRVCIGAACHVKGAEKLLESFRQVLHIDGDEDTDADGLFTVSEVACLGCCMLAPAVQIDDDIFGWCSPADCAAILREFLHRVSQRRQEEPLAGGRGGAGHRGEAALCLCSSCTAAGSRAIFRSCSELVCRHRFPVTLREVACSGMSYRTPLLKITAADDRVYHYGGVRAEQLFPILQRHFGAAADPVAKGKNKLREIASRLYDRQLHCHCAENVPDQEYQTGQVRIATEYSHLLSPLDLDGYRARGGFDALDLVRRQDTARSLEEVRAAGLRGRGGGGFPTWQKWRAALEVAADRWLICNADEGDPGAFMDRMLLESFPFRIIEGMLIAAHVLEAHQGLIYIRAEYAQAVQTLTAALALLHRRQILPTAGGFDLRLFVGAGAFVCGEETALIASLEGRRGSPASRPPYPASKGYHGLPTVINNVETFACLPWIFRHGSVAFSAIGTPGSHGSKTFALAGKVQRGGLIEVPMGLTIRQILEEIGGGAEEGHRFKAVQIGGPSGGCLPERLFDLPVDYDELVNAGAIMGSGGLVALDERDCMVDIARYFLRFTAAESCGKCLYCRLGTQQMLAIFDRLCRGEGTPADLPRLQELGQMVKAGSRCGLGRTAPNPVLTALRYFPEEFAAHLGGRCPAGKCQALTRFVITSRCVGCTLCAQNCAAAAIPFTPYEQHHIDQALCVRCGVCRNVCPAGAVESEHE